jgi:very-short-patch-repair endonuclease
MPFYRYALDFAWPEKRLCIEIDGKQHLYDEKQIARDIEKDRLLKEDGWKELRLKWGYVVAKKEEAIKLITDFLNECGNITIPMYKSQLEIWEEKVWRKLYINLPNTVL